MKACLLFLCLISCQITPQKGPKPLVGTSPVQGDADACAIWIDRADPTRSTIIGNDKTRDGALYVWELTSGQEISRTLLNQPVNPSVRQGVNFGGRVLDIVGCALRSNNTVQLFSIDSNTRALTKLTTSEIPTGFSADTYGFTLYLRPDDARLFAFVSQKKKSANIHQIELFADGTGKLIRSFGGSDQVSYVEGMVVDDEAGFLYCCDEEGGVLKYHADPRRGDDELIHRFAEEDGIVGDREGIALYALPQEMGYLVLSSQGNSTIKLYTRATNEFVATIVTQDALHTDGVAASSAAIEPYFPTGVLVCHDEKKNRFVVYSWKDVMSYVP